MPPHAQRWERIETRYPTLRAHLGTMPDSRLARVVGCSLFIVRTFRTHLGIPTYSKPSPLKKTPEERIEARHPGLLLRLSFEKDITLARAYGISRQRIEQIRTTLNLPSYRLHKTQLVTSLLPEADDSVVAQATRLSQSTVTKIRKRSGIPRPRDIQRNEDVLRTTPLLGTMSDADVAHKAGVGRGFVFALRRQLGIKPFSTSPRCADYVRLDREHIRRAFAEGKSDAEIALEVGSRNPQSIAQIRHQLGLMRHR